MATIALSNIVEITGKVTGFKGRGLNIGGMPMAVFRIAAGQAAGDTAVLASAQCPVIQTVDGPVTHSIPLTNVTGVTAVTVTLAAVTGSAITVTVGTVDVWLFGPVPTS